MKFTPILPDPDRLRAAGLHSLTSACALIHIARCGLQGTTITGLCEALNLSPEGARNALSPGIAAGLISKSGRDGKQGRPHRYIVSTAGWQLVTTPASLDPFPFAQTPLPKI